MITKADERIKRELAEQEKRLNLSLGQVADLTYWGQRHSKALYTGARATFNLWGSYFDLKMVFEHEGDYNGTPIINSAWIPPFDIAIRGGIYVVEQGRNICQANLFPLSSQSSSLEREEFIVALARLKEHNALDDKRLANWPLTAEDAIYLRLRHSA